MTIKSEITLIKGDGRYPSPQTRVIRPLKSLIWKFYLKTFLVWLATLFGIVVSLLLIEFFASLDPSDIPAFPAEFYPFLFVGFLVVTIIIIPIILFLILIYVQNMAFIVHGDEIIVQKGLINKTVKYCPFRTITNVSTQVGVFDRLFRIGCINIQTAGVSGSTGGPEEKLEGLKVYHEIRQYIIQQIREVHSTESLLSKGDNSKTILRQAILQELNGVKREFIRKKGVNNLE
ncbi:MAG: PH domain-containing protein [Candidatus Hodarchaeales archaeon]|jgi:uncharacterized membrane protein YdbT with pleckstrin-like domain